MALPKIPSDFVKARQSDGCKLPFSITVFLVDAAAAARQSQPYPPSIYAVPVFLYMRRMRLRTPSVFALPAR